jgi:hypothetical protein
VSGVVSDPLLARRLPVVRKVQVRCAWTRPGERQEELSTGLSGAECAPLASRGEAGRGPCLGRSRPPGRGRGASCVRRKGAGNEVVGGWLRCVAAAVEVGGWRTVRPPRRGYTGSTRLVRAFRLPPHLVLRRPCGTGGREWWAGPCFRWPG